MAKRMLEQKRTKNKCGKIEIYSDETVFSCSNKFLIRENPFASKSPEIFIATEKPESRRRINSKSDTASSSQARLQEAYFGGLMDTAMEKLVATKENPGDVDISESQTGCGENVTGRPVAHKISLEKTHGMHHVWRMTMATLMKQVQELGSKDTRKEMLRRTCTAD